MPILIQYGAKKKTFLKIAANKSKVLKLNEQSHYVLIDEQTKQVLSKTKAKLVGNDLVVTHDDGAQVVFRDYATHLQSGSTPVVQFAEGVWTPPAIETAAATTAEGGATTVSAEWLNNGWLWAAGGVLLAGAAGGGGGGGGGGNNSSAVYSSPVFVETPTKQSAINALLTNDGDNASWLSPAASVPTVGQPLVLTYAFQNQGAYFYNGGIGGYDTIDLPFNPDAKVHVRAILSLIAEFTNLQFNETTAQTLRGADLRFFSGSVAQLDAEGMYAYAYQPSPMVDKASQPDYAGDVFVIQDYVDAISWRTPYANPFNPEVMTLTHEIGHALGLDHSFNENANNAGFYGFESDVLGVNRLGGLSGGGHDSSLADTPLETVMTYHDPWSYLGGLYVNSTGGGVTDNSIAPWKYGIYDIAALQSLYGANYTTRAGNTSYTYDSTERVFDTIWDGGGVDTIVQNGAVGAYINLNEGSMSRVGAAPVLDVHLTFSPNKHGQIQSYHLLDPNAATVTMDEDGYGLTFHANLSEGSTFDGTLGIEIVMADNHVWANYDDAGVSYALQSDSMYNLGIAYGVTIENAVGGSGDDVLVGNQVANQLTGGAGADVFVFAEAFGVDTITDFVVGQDVLRLSNAMQGHTQWSAERHVLSVTGFGEIQLTHVTQLVAGVDYIFV